MSISYSISIDICNQLLSLNSSWTHFHLRRVCYLDLLLHYSGSVDGAKIPCGSKPKMFTILTSTGKFCLSVVYVSDFKLCSVDTIQASQGKERSRWWNPGSQHLPTKIDPLIDPN